VAEFEKALICKPVPATLARHAGSAIQLKRALDVP